MPKLSTWLCRSVFRQIAPLVAWLLPVICVLFFHRTALAAGYAPGCYQYAPPGWTRTIWWVSGQRWEPVGKKIGPWRGKTKVRVKESNIRGAQCSSTGSEAYQDGQKWWGTFRQFYRNVSRGERWEPSFGKKRFERDTWWAGWVAPQPPIAGMPVRGYWLKSTTADGGGPGDESVFVANDEEIWIEVAEPTPAPPTATPLPGTVRFTVRQCSTSGPLLETWVSVWAGVNEWSDGAYGSQLSFFPPGQFTQVGFSVASRDGWSPLNIDGVANVASTEVIVMTSSDCNAPTPALTATPTEPVVIGCASYHDVYYHDAALLAPGAVEDQHGQQVELPTSQSGTVPTLRPEQNVFVFNNDRLLYADADNDADKRGYELANETGMLLQLERQRPDGTWERIGQAGFLALLTGDYAQWAPALINNDVNGKVVTWGVHVTAANPPWGQNIPSWIGKAAGSLPAIVQVDGNLAPGRYRWISTNRAAGWGIGSGYSLPDSWNGEPADLDCPEGVRSVNYYFDVADGAMTIRVQRSTMTGAEPVPIGGAQITIEGARPGHETLTTDSSGVARFLWSERMTPGTNANIVPTSITLPGEVGEGNFVWKIGQTCGRAATESELNAKRYDNVSGPCSLTFTYVPRPAYSAIVMRIKSFYDPACPFASQARPFFGSNTCRGERWDWSAQLVVDEPGNPSGGFAPATVGPSGAARIVPPVNTARKWVTSQPRLRLRVIDPTLWINGAAHPWACNQRQVRAVGGKVVEDPGLACSRYIVLQSPAPSIGNYFLYAQGNIRVITFAGFVRTAGTDQPEAGIGVSIHVNQGSQVLTEHMFSGTDGSYSFSWSPVFPGPSSPPTAVRVNISTPRGRTLARLQPGSLEPAIVDRPAVDQSRFTWALPASFWAELRTYDNNFYLNSPVPPPPQPPVVTGQIYLNLHSTYDPRHKEANPRASVYRSTGQQIAWPQGEVLDFTPYLALNRIEDNSDFYNFRITPIAWSLLSSKVNERERSATAKDDLGRMGCRARNEPAANPAADLGRLEGCRYHYIGDQTATQVPTRDEMALQGHIYWSAFLPQSMRDDVYMYRLAPVRPAHVRLQVAVLVEVVNRDGTPAVDPVTLEPVRNTQIIEGNIKVSMVVPRSAR